MKIVKRKRVQTVIEGKTMTQQHQKEQCDVNSIIEKYRKTGHIAHTRKGEGRYGDFSKYHDFRANLELVSDAQTQFDALPAHLRKRFANDPANLVEFLLDPSNKEEAQKLGLVPQPEKKSEAQNDDKTTKKASDTPPATQPALQA